MAETSGFFEAMYDETEEVWDRVYLAEQFANFFNLFIKNGVFGTPTNQLRVIPGPGLSVMITPGWAFINGYWYHNDANVTITVTSNPTYSTRTDAIILRMTQVDREIQSLILTGSTELTRSDTVYDIQLATINVAPNAVTIPDSNITDTRMNESVCGFVTGVLRVETTEDLFAQYNALFNDWFDTVKDQVTGDLAIRLQQEFTELNETVEEYQQNVEAQIEEYQQNVEAQIEEYQQNVEAQVDIAEGLIENYVDNDYVIQEQAFSFVNKVCTISDSKIKSTSLIDVYFTAATIAEAEECQIVVDSGAGVITLTAVKQPNSEIRGLIRVRVN